jgi:hypothetical protein
MPFKSKAQLRQCFAREYAAKFRGEPSTWNCRGWLSETPNPECLPEKTGGKPACRKMYRTEAVIGPIKTGPKGGRYFMVGDIKVYLPKE